MDKCAYSNTDSVGRLGRAGEQGIMTPSVSKVREVRQGKVSQILYIGRQPRSGTLLDQRP
jgi:hypothetical protein